MVQVWNGANEIRTLIIVQVIFKDNVFKWCIRNLVKILKCVLF